MQSADKMNQSASDVDIEQLWRLWQDNLEAEIDANRPSFRPTRQTTMRPVQASFRKHLGQLLQTLVMELDGEHGSLWLFERNSFRLNLCATRSDEQVRTYAPPDNAIVRLDQGRQCQLRRNEVLFDFGDDILIDPLLKIQRSDWLHAGINSVITVSISAGSELQGLFSIQRSTASRPTKPQVQLARRLASHATLAIEVSRLSTDHNRRAVREERLRLEQERAAALAESERTLRDTLDVVASDPQVDRFLKEVVAAMTRRLNALSASLWLFDKQMQFSDLHYVYPCAPTDDTVGYKGFRVEVDANGLHSIFERRPYVIADMNDDPNVLPQRRTQLQRSGVFSLLVVPLVLQKRAIGCVSLRYAAPPKPSPEELSVAQTLANQATLGIALTELAEKAQKAAILDERTRVARDLHDALTQVFTGMALQLDVAQRLLGEDESPVAEVIERCAELARQGLNEARRSVTELHAGQKDEGDLASDVRETLRRMTEGTAVRTEFRQRGRAYELDADVSLNLLRVMQEAVTNALRHGAPRSVVVYLSFKSGHVTLLICDDGRGMPQHNQATRNGFGLANIQHRARHIGGRLRIGSKPGLGTRVAVRVTV